MSTGWIRSDASPTRRRRAFPSSYGIPLIVRCPRVARAGSTPDKLVQTIDFASTMLALAGVRDTVRRQRTSLVPLLSGRPVSWRSSLFLEYYTDIVFPRTFRMGYDAVRTERHTYIVYRELPGIDELYDLQRDPYQMDNLIGTSRAELQRLITAASAR